MNKVFEILRYHIPQEFSIQQENGNILIRDNTVDRGKGYQIKVTLEPRYLYSEIEFENYSKQLIDYVGGSLNSEKEASFGYSYRAQKAVEGSDLVGGR